MSLHSERQLSVWRVAEDEPRAKEGQEILARQTIRQEQSARGTRPIAGLPTEGGSPMGQPRPLRDRWIIPRHHEDGSIYLDYVNCQAPANAPEAFASLEDAKAFATQWKAVLDQREQEFRSREAEATEAKRDQQAT